MASILSPSQHPSFPCSHHWFGGQVSAVFPPKADARGDPPELARSCTQWGVISSSTCCVSSHTRYPTCINVWNATSAASSWASLPSYARRKKPFPSLISFWPGTNSCKERGGWWDTCFLFPFLCFFFFYHRKISVVKETQCVVWVVKCSVGLAVNRRQVVVTVPGQLGIAHLLSYLLVTHILSPPPSYLPIVQLLSLVF